jgi:tetratricopeptide (TPR) repeat protein
MARTATAEAVPVEAAVARAIGLAQAGDLAKAEELCRELLARHPHSAAALHAFGVVAYMRKDYADAIDRFAQATSIEGANPQYLSNLGEAQRRAGRPEEALATFEKALLNRPEFLKAHLGVANALRDLGRYAEAVARYRLALAVDPTFAEAYHYLAAEFMRQGRNADAIPLLRKALALRGSYKDAEILLANALEAENETEEALAIYRAILERDPNNTAVLNNVGNMLKALGRMDEAVAHYQKALAVEPNHVQAYYNLSRAQVATPDAAEVERMERLVEEPGLTAEQRVNVHFALGKIYDDAGDYAKAFRHFRLGNEIDRPEQTFDLAAHGALIDRLIATFTADFIASREGFGSESDLPIFVVGMPRSGTTLVEQTLASHPAVHGAGELSHLGRIVLSLPAALDRLGDYPECVAHLDAVTACRLAEEYLTELRHLGQGKRRVVDKMPGNFLHLGVIALLLPRARVIHCRRDPLDTCLSCYSQRFTGGMPFTKDLAVLGRYFRDYERLMAHWRRVLPLSLLDVRYEDMVADHESMSRIIVDFSGLEWNDACLAFHTTERQVKTASSWQVRQPIYTHSVERWRRYEAFLGPLQEALGIEVAAPAGEAKGKGKNKRKGKAAP